jgi:hypothetical protein
MMIGDRGHVVFSFENHAFSFEMTSNEWWDVAYMCAPCYEGSVVNCGVNLDGTNYDISQTIDEVNLTVKSDNITYTFPKNVMIDIFSQIAFNSA